jgi:hypothetical protein
LGGKVDVFDLNANHIGHRSSVDKIDVGRTVFAESSSSSQFFMKMPIDLMALLLEQPGCHGRVHPTTQSHDHAPF